MTKTRALALLLPYLAFIFFITVGVQSKYVIPSARRLNLVPMRMVGHFTREAAWWSQHPSPRAVWVIGRGFVVNVVGNLGVLAPLGFLLPVVCGRRFTAWHALGAGAALSLLIETLQFLSGRRIADVDDVWLNALGAVLGYWCAAGLGLAGRGRSADDADFHR